MSTQISHLPDEIVVDDAIVLRAKSSDMFEAFAVVARENRSHLEGWLPWAANTPDESSVTHYHFAPEKKAANETADWDIYVSGQMSGAIGIKTREENSRILEIGYWLAKNAVGKGIVAKSTETLVDLIFNETDTPAIEIACDKANIKSAAVAVRCGFTLDREVDRTHSQNKAPLETDTGQFYKLTRKQWIQRSSDRPTQK